MDRPVRLRRVPLKFSGDENIVANKPRNNNKKMAKVNSDDNESLNEATKSLSSKSEKGILLAGKKTLTQISPLPVLRDRTNLPAEPFKVDIFMKKGTDDISTKKTTKLTAKRTRNEEVESEGPTRAKRLRSAKAKDSEAAKETMDNLPLQKERTRKVVIEDENNEKVVKQVENTRNASAGKEKYEKADKDKENENTHDELTAIEKGKNEMAKGKAKNLQVETTSKKLKSIKEASAPTNVDDSLIVESENVADSQNTPKLRSATGLRGKISKRVAFSKLSLSRQSNKSFENRKKKSQSQSSELRKKVKDKATTSETAAGKKFFKSKVTSVEPEEILPSKKIVTGKRRNVETPRVSTSFRLRQTTLSESFAKHATKKNLRTRVAWKNYHESIIADGTATTDKDKTKGPVYKTAKFLEKSDNDDSEIYEFHFDSNDSREKIAKKKRKKVGRNVTTKKRAKASATKKTTSKTTAATKTTVKENKVENLQPVLPAISDEPIDTNDVPAIVINDCDMSPVPGKSEKIKTQPKRLEPQPQRTESLKVKPKVVKSLDLTGDMKLNLTSTPQLAKSSETNIRPMRTANDVNVPRPSAQYRTMLNHALLNKSLSPIKKALENFDPGSPWRPPIFTGLQFSRVKNVVQSTPQVRKFSTMLESNRNSLESKTELPSVQIDKRSERMDANVESTSSKAQAQMNEIARNDGKSTNVEQTTNKASAKINKIAEKDEKNAKVEQKNIIKPKVQKIVEQLVKSPRKFGTVISNVNVAISSTNPVTFQGNNAKSEINRGSPRQNQSIALSRPAETSDTRISDGNDFDDHVDKENSIPIFTSPKKTPTKLIAKQSPLRHFDQAKIATKENFDPQPGPSGLQKRSDLSESRILRQSNLNNFLNIERVPTSTRISTPHGIFADPHSTPLPGKSVKVRTTEANVENAFGFDDIAEPDINLSPIKSQLFADPPVGKVAKKIFEKRRKIDGQKGIIAPSRFSIGEIKKHLRPIASNGKAKIDSVERIEKDDNRAIREEKATNEKDEDAVTFSDSFDVFTGAANDKENAHQVPLFEDLEPVHFKQPPRHSYKRKRIVAFDFSDEEEENEDGESHDRRDKNETKKKKISKVDKKRQKQIEEWAKGLNNTFEEIDHFDLLVEKQ